jgi:hypothetical protein
VFAARDTTVDELAQEVPLVRFETLTPVRVRTLRAGGFRLDPTSTPNELRERAQRAVLAVGDDAFSVVLRIGSQCAENSMWAAGRARHPECCGTAAP